VSDDPIDGAGDAPPSDPPAPPSGDAAASGSSGSSVKIGAKKESTLWKKDFEKKEVGVGDRKPKDPNAPADPNAAKPDADTKKPESKAPEVQIAIKALYKAQAQGTVAKIGDDKTFAAFLSGKASAEALGASLNVNQKKATLTVVNAKAEGTVASAQVDLVDMVKKLFGVDEKPPPPPAGPMSPMAARVMDLTTHGTPLAPGPGSTNVFIGSLPAWRATIDMCVCAAPGAAPHGAGPAAIGEPTVLINSMPAIRMGDWVNEPTGGPNVIVQGCPTVFIGTPAGAPPPFKPPGEDDLPRVIFESVASAAVGAAEAQAKADASVDLLKAKGAVEGKIGGSAALAKASLPLKVRLRIPFTTYYAGLGVEGTATIGSVGAEAGGKVKVNDGKQLFEVSGGAGAHLGGGLAAKFSLDVSEK
jgi:uncharacterized Zn-binding protein involved in type VI secretion